jgi:hypothetical protein
LHFTPIYSSWLNQVEIRFSRIEREVISRGVFSSVSDLARKLIFTAPIRLMPNPSSGNTPIPPAILVTFSL